MKADENKLEIDSDYFHNMSKLGYDDEQADSFVKIIKKCAASDGALGAATGGMTGLVIGGTVTLGSLAVPGWVMGIVVGGIVGEVKCAYKPVRAMIKHEKDLLKNEIDRILNFKFLTDAIEN